jgi:BirA family biotin operon repressor/biotin-[acetyl-CoA-carboxylase] ligase
MIKELKYEYYESVDSTNERIKERARAGEDEGLVISALFQTAGRGRIGRKWEGEKNKCIATSMLLYQNNMPPNVIPAITILCGLAVRKTIENLYDLSCQIKWPNDIIINGKKLSGILVEYENLNNGLAFLTLGIGINVHQDMFRGELEDKATSIRIELANYEEKYKYVEEYENEEIIEEIWESFLYYYNEFIKTYSLSFIKGEYEKYLVNIGKTVRVETGKDCYEAIALGISDYGGLIINADGEKKEIKNYEVSVRGIYGYV